jgi:hypothetical protein
MNSDGRRALIDRLTNRQSISIAKFMTDFLEEKTSESSLPQEEDSQKRALSDILMQYGHNIDLTTSKQEENVNEETVGIAAKQLLLFISESQDEELLNRLDGHLDSPPTGGVAAIEPASLAIFLPTVIAGCIALLNVVGGISYENGKWSFNRRRRPGEPDPVERNLKSFGGILGAVFGRSSTKA